MIMKNDDELRHPIPPYIPFKTLVNFISKLKDTAVPDRIDRTMLRGYSGAVAGALVPALKYLSLIDDDGKTTDRMRQLVSSYGTDAWKMQIEDMLTYSYAPLVMNLNITSATKGMLEDEFKKTGAEKSVISKCMAFYVAALREAGVNISPHITETLRGKRDQSKKKSPKTKQDRKDMTDDETEDKPGVTIPGTVKFDIPVLPGKPSVRVYIPENISKAEWEIVNSTMAGYISLLEQKK